MMLKNINSKIIFFLMLLIISNFFVSSIPGSLNTYKDTDSNSYFTGNEYELPAPLSLDISVEEALMKRMSVRNYTDQPVTEKQLSTVLWSAYGERSDGTHTVPKINNTYSTVIYVIKEDAVYTYNPKNHSLVFYKEGDYRDMVSDSPWQYWSPIQLGLCWNTDLSDKNFAAAQVGTVGQNIYFSAIAQNLGTIITTSNTSDPEPIGLPENHKAIAMMSLGHPKYDYNLKYRPFCISLLPRITFSEKNLTTALKTRETTTEWSDEKLSRKDISHLTWSSYGYSYYIDRTQADMGFVKRHHTLPSCHGFYPFRIYVVTGSGIYRYMYGMFTIDSTILPFPIRLIGQGIPSYFFVPVSLGDHRENMANATENYVKNAPYCLIPVMDIQKTKSWDDLSSAEHRWNFYYEAGASSYNVLIEAASRNLSGTIVSVKDKDVVCKLLKLDEEKFDPMFIVPVGNKKT